MPQDNSYQAHLNKKSSILLVNNSYVLQKYPGKGGWTYAAIPEVIQDKKTHFGWVKVKGFIDHYELKHHRLMPMGNGKLFLPVKAEIRKKIGKIAGDTVRVILYADHDPIEIPEEFQHCLNDEPIAKELFLTYSESEQKAFIDWIYRAKQPDTRAEKIVKAIKMILKGDHLNTN